MIKNLTSDKEKIFRDLLQKNGIAISKRENDIIKCQYKEKYELSFEQQRIWFLSQLNQESPAYNIPYILKIEDNIDINKVNRIVNRIISRHEILRTIFIEEMGIPYQIILDSYQIELSINNIEDNNITIQKKIVSETTQPFELYGKPLIRGMILETNEKSYYMVITLHHLVTDGCSMEILFKEFSILYSEEMSILPEIPFQYVDYCEWQKKCIGEMNWNIDEEYWKKQFNTLPEALSLVLDYSMNIEKYGKGKLYRFSIDKGTIEKFKNLCREYGTTLFHGLLAVYRILLFRYTSQKDITIGIPTAGRTLAGVENTLGLFVNTLALRMPVDENQIFSDYLNYVRDICFEALNHQNYPLHYLIKSLNINSESHYLPLFQTMFTMQNMPVSSQKFQDIPIKSILIDNQYAQYPISITVWENEQNELEGTWEYDEGLFKEETIQRFSRHYIALIQNILNNPQCLVSKFEMLSSAEKQQIIYDWNSTEKDFDRSLTVYDLFENQALSVPEHISICFRNNKVTYKHLFRMIIHWSNYLCKLGVKKNDIVVIHEAISIEMIAIIFSLIRIGAIYVPVDVEIPMDRLQYIIGDICPDYIISESDYEIFNGLIHIRLSIDNIIDTNIKGMKKYTASDIACVIYTSGSTGIPKGVWIRNVAITNLIYSFLNSYECTDKDKMLPITSISSASFIGEIFPMLCNGGTLILADKYEYLDTEKMISLIEKEQITIISTVSSVIAKLNQMDIPRNNLRLILSGGEVLLPMDINNLSQSIKIVNGYGLTEAAVCSTYHVLGDSRDISSNISIGKPIMNTRVYIFDSYGNISPIGSVGELYIGGLGISPGYVNDDELTAEKFICSPFISEERLLKTGDLAYWNSSGEIMYYGRRDEQVKIHGYRIELREIQYVLNNHSFIYDSAVYIMENQQHEKKIHALIEMKNEKELTKVELIEWLSERLPSYMVPKSFFVTHEIPHNLNGKVDWEKIRMGNFRQMISGLSSTNRVTQEEKMVAEIWKELLNRDEIEYNINFFDSGGHSLLLPQLQSRLNEISYNRINIMDLFRYTTISAQSKLLKQSIFMESKSDMETRTTKQRAALNNKYMQNRRNKYESRRTL